MSDTRMRTRLAWVQRNSERRPPAARTIGTAAARLAEAIGAQGQTVSEAADRLAALVDETFRRHCRVAQVASGRLEVHVNHPGLVATMRAEWHGALQAAARQGALGRTVREIRFAYGTEGCTLVEPAPTAR